MLLQHIPYPDGSGGGGSLSYITGENLAGSTLTGASVDAVTISGSTLKASTDYLLIASADLDCSSTASDAQIAVYNGATKLNTGNPRYHEVGAGDGPRNLSFMRKVTTSGTPSSDSWILKVQQSGSGATITYTKCRLLLVELTSLHKYAESVARQTYSSPANTTASAAVSLTFTPASAGDYLVIGFGLVDRNFAGGPLVTVELTDGTNTSGPHNILQTGSGETSPFALPVLARSLSGSTTFSLNLKDGAASASDVLGISDACIVALRLDQFANAYVNVRSTSYDQLLTGVTSTSGLLTYLPNAADHLTMGFGGFYGAATISVSCQVDDDGTIMSQPTFRKNVNNTEVTAFFAARIAAYSAAKRTTKITMNSNGFAQTVEFPSVAVLDLGGGSSTGAGSLTLRSSSIQQGGAVSSFAATLPAGAAAGDTCFLFTGGAWGTSTVGSGWTRLDNMQGGNYNGAVYYKVLTAGDISTGTVTVTFAGSANATVAMACFNGSPRGIRFLDASRNSSGSTSRALASDSTPRNGDYVLCWGSCQLNGARSCNVGSPLQTVSGANSSSVLNGGSLGASGAFTTTFTYGATPTGDYQAVLVLYS